MAIVPSSPLFAQGKLFDLDYCRDRANERFLELRTSLEQRGIACGTLDQFAPEDVDVLIFYSIAMDIGAVISVVKRNPGVLLLNVPTEPSFIAPFHEPEILATMPFDRILTWHDDLASSGGAFVKANIGEPVIDPDTIPALPFRERKLVCCIYSSKHTKGANSLYGERMRAIDSLSATPESLDLYGMGWEKSTRASVKAVYRGSCASKREVMQRYRFAICFENAKGYPGLITEKIFDCFAAGTVPIYMGAPNVDLYIPRSCYVRFEEGGDYDALYQRLSQISESEYQGYLDAARQFIRSDGYRLFTSKHFAEIVCAQIDELRTQEPPERTLSQFRVSLMRALMKRPLLMFRNLPRLLRFIYGAYKHV